MDADGIKTAIDELPVRSFVGSLNVFLHLCELPADAADIVLSADFQKSMAPTELRIGGDGLLHFTKYDRPAAAEPNAPGSRVADRFHGRRRDHKLRGV